MWRISSDGDGERWETATEYIDTHIKKKKSCCQKPRFVLIALPPSIFYLSFCFVLLCLLAFLSLPHDCCETACEKEKTPAQSGVSCPKADFKL
ncbi:hypothetical protein V6N13_017310 [Hibiscus sabdariffa]